MSTFKYYKNGQWNYVNGAITGDTLPIGAEVDFIGEAVPAGWEQVSNYSTSEINTGKTWIDGKPIYSIVVNVGALPNNTSLNVPTSTFDGANKFITQMYGIGASSQEEYLKIPYYATDQNYINLIINSTHQISISTGADRSRFTGYIYLEYTKTTD